MSIRRWICVTWVMVGLFCLVWGGLAWWELRQQEQGPREAVAEFMVAMASDNREAALDLLSPNFRKELDAPDDDPFAWEAIPDLKHEIRQLHLVPGHARVELSISQSGFKVQAELELQQAADGRWLIDEIDLDKIDSRWQLAHERVRREREQQAARDNEKLAEQLRRALSPEAGRETQIAQPDTGKRR